MQVHAILLYLYFEKKLEKRHFYFQLLSKFKHIAWRVDKKQYFSCKLLIKKFKACTIESNVIVLNECIKIKNKSISEWKRN